MKRPTDIVFQSKTSRSLLLVRLRLCAHWYHIILSLKEYVLWKSSMKGNISARIDRLAYSNSKVQPKQKNWWLKISIFFFHCIDFNQYFEYVTAFYHYFLVWFDYFQAVGVHCVPVPYHGGDGHNLRYTKDYTISLWVGKCSSF